MSGLDVEITMCHLELNACTEQDLVILPKKGINVD